MKLKTCSFSLLVATSAVFILVLCFMVSCSARKTVTERVVVHDTLQTYHSDTVKLSTRTMRADTVRESQVKVVTLRQDSSHTDTVRVEILRERWHTVYVTDTTNAYRYLADSLQVMKDRMVEKKQTTIRKNGIIRWFLIISLVAMALIIIGVIRRR